MEKLTIFLFIAILSSGALGMNVRSRRQAQTGDSTPTQQAAQGGTQPSPNSGNDVRECIRSCPVTTEYNPVCGTNNETYTNPGRLLCAQACGVNVTLLRQSRCTPPPSN